jgi:hypothetical protein
MTGPSCSNGLARGPQVLGTEALRCPRGRGVLGDAGKHPALAMNHEAR